VEGRARRRLSGILVGAALASACAIGCARAAVGPTEQRGIFALLSGTPKIVSEFWAEHAEGLNATLKIRQFRLDGATPIHNYDVDMQRIIHLIVVRDDFATFAHLHPSFDATTGTFSQPFAKVPNHRYYVYADTTPHGLGQQAFRFTIESDGPLATSQPSLRASATSVGVGAYTVALARTTLSSGAPQSVDLTILKGSQPAPDLGTYLGAAAHAVLIDTATLAYVHVHPALRGASDASMGATMNMNGSSGPLLSLNLPALPAGTYKLWIQFTRAGNTVYTAPFTIRVR
jgi:hypothetical protein